MPVHRFADADSAPSPGAAARSAKSAATAEAPDVSGNSTDPLGAAPTTGPAALGRLSGQIQEIRDYLAWYFATQVDGVKLVVRSLMFKALLACLALLVGAAMLVTATVIAVIGAANGLGHLFGDRFWLGHLALGLVLLAAAAGSVYALVRKLTNNSRERTIEKYARRRHEQERARQS